MRHPRLGHALLPVLLVAALVPAAARGADTDADGVPDASDNCPLTFNPSQDDRGGIASAAPDGVGDACQNADWNHDGKVDVLDATLLRRALAGLPPSEDPRQPPNPTCPVGFCDSDGDPANGCEDPLDDNPTCAVTGSLGSVYGDVSGSSFSVSGRGEIWGSATVLEGAGPLSTQDLHARITLQPPPDANYDLYVTCASCSPTPLGSSQPGSNLETIDVGVIDHTGADDAFPITIEVRWIGGLGCGAWTLTVTGDTGEALTCN